MFSLGACTARALDDDDHFRFDIVLGLMKARVRGVRRLLTEQERERVAQTIVEHLRLSRWQWWRAPSEVGPGYMASMAEDRSSESGAPQNERAGHLSFGWDF